MKKFAALLLVLAMAAVANATNPVSLGYSDQGTVIPAGADACANGTLYVNHDGSFENGYAWQYGGVVAPYYGSFGEGYQLGEGTVNCGALFLSTSPGYYTGQTLDLYVWNGALAPGTVAGMVANVSISTPGSWPTITQHDIEANVAVAGDFTVGYWGNWPGLLTGWFCGADLDGFGGIPWTYIAPGIGYPTGWTDPSVVWGPTQSMGCGAYFTPGPPTPAETQSWGSIKALFE